MNRAILKWSVILVCVYVTFLALGEAKDPPRGWRRQIKKEKDKLPEIRQFIKEHVEKWQRNWENSKKRELFELTDDQADVWRKLHEFEEEDGDDDDKKKGKKGRKKREGPLIARPKKTRKEWRHMTTREKRRFIAAIHNVATFIPDPSRPGISLYKMFVEFHQFRNSPAAHGGAAFLPWHREFLWRFRNALKIYGNYSGELPYFDSALDQFLPEPRDSAFFMENHEGFGSDGGVLGDPFSSEVVEQIDSCFGGADVTRNARPAAFSRQLLYTRGRYETILGKRCFDHLTWPTDGDMEGFHDTGHTFVAGTMNEAPCSPGDPMFWLHHSNVDCLWEEYRQTQQNPGTRSLQYPQNRFGGSDHAWNAPMRPFDDWGLMNIHGLSNHYGNYYYRCKDRPSKEPCQNDNDCTQPRQGLRQMLWCETNTNFCVAKIRVGGACNNAWPDNQCFCINENATPRCTNSRCRCN